jgi:Protein of unknown function (DUF3551)
MKILGPLSILTATILWSAFAANAQQDQPFCLRHGEGKLDCHFETMAQCQEALKADPTKATGTCVPNPKTKR